ncbi:MAG: hypothetical protein HYT87_06975 [Nitrospirae bacterium]|nr:hypothetical protein [Nitrospirota bacterium]
MKRTNEVETFCRQVRARSAENRQAMLAVRALPGQMISVLRQEIDSPVRVVFLLAQDDRDYRQTLIEESVSGQRWRRRNSKQHVTDREMVDLTNTLHGWTRSVYAFGCAFVHLSNFHDHQTRDPLDQISAAERNAVLDHLRHYHGGPNGAAPTFLELMPFLPRVFAKIADNLECYVKQLEQDDNLET